MKKLVIKILAVIVTVTAMLGLIILPKTEVQASEFTFGATQGASVKYGELNETGLRFTIEVDKEFYASLDSGVVFGALISTNDYVTKSLNGNLAINENDSKIADVRYVTNVNKFDKDQPAEADRHVYYASITYTFNDDWNAEVLESHRSEMPTATDEEIIEKAKLQALSTELVCRPYYLIGEQVVYANLSNARSMVKVANAAYIAGEPITDDFASKYLSTLVESDSEVYILADGTVIGLSNQDEEVLNGAIITADDSASDIEFIIENDVLTNAETFLADKTEDNYYYITAFKGHQVYRIKYLYGSVKCTEGLEFTLINNDTEYKVTNYTGTDTEVVIPSIYNGKPVTSIGENAFSSCYSLTSIEIPESVTSIGSSAFYYCSKLTSIEIPSSVTSIGEYAFDHCYSLTSIEIPAGVTSIGSFAFYYCSKLTSIEIPSGVTYIGTFAFGECDSLMSIEIPSSVITIRAGAFLGSNSLTNIVVDKNNINYKDVDGDLYSKDGKTLMQYAIGKTATEFIIPDYVTAINAAFSGCTSLTSIKIPFGVKYIYPESFSQCILLTDVQIPSSVTHIDSWSFMGCSSLTKIIIPNSVKYLSNLAFWNCSALTIYCEAESQPTTWESNWNPDNRPVYYYSENLPTIDGDYWHYKISGEIELWSEHIHEYGNVITAPTCEEKGYTTYTCACGDSYMDNYVDALGHTYEEVITTPTCEEKGYTTYTCACGDSYIDNYVDAIGHNYGDFISNGNDTHTSVCKNDSTHVITEECCGGTPTEEEKAICEICNTEYGSLLGEHNFEYNIYGWSVAAGRIVEMRVYLYCTDTYCGYKEYFTFYEDSPNVIFPSCESGGFLDFGIIDGQEVTMEIPKFQHEFDFDVYDNEHYVYCIYCGQYFYENCYHDDFVLLVFDEYAHSYECTLCGALIIGQAHTSHYSNWALCGFDEIGHTIFCEICCMEIWQEHYGDEFCYGCGFEICNHEEIFFVYINEYYHEVICCKCGLSLDCIEHYWDENGYCDVCGEYST